MANAIYPKYKEAVLQSSSDSSLGGTVKVALIDTGTYTYSASHQYLSDVSGVVGTAVTLGTKTYTNGTFDAANVTFTAVSGATVEAFLVYIDTGVAGTSRLVYYQDANVTGLPVTPNGGDINLNFNASGIFTI